MLLFDPSPAPPARVTAEEAKGLVMGRSDNALDRYERVALRSHENEIIARPARVQNLHCVAGVSADRQRKTLLCHRPEVLYCLIPQHALFSVQKRRACC